MSLPACITLHKSFHRSEPQLLYLSNRGSKCWRAELRLLLPRASTRWVRPLVILIFSSLDLDSWAQQGLSLSLAYIIQRKGEPEWSHRRALQPCTGSDVQIPHSASFGGLEGCFPICACHTKQDTVDQHFQERQCGSQGCLGVVAISWGMTSME